MNSNEYILNLVSEALDAINTKSSPLSAIIQKSVRISRLRNDYLNLWWLESELVNYTDEQERSRILKECICHLPKGNLECFHKKYGEIWIKERKTIKADITFDRNSEIKYEDNIAAKGVEQIEVDIAHYTQVADGSLDRYFNEPNISKARFVGSDYVKSFNVILERIKYRVFDFLSLTEKELLYGQLNTDIFDKNRQYVDLKLGQLCPDALGKFVSAYQRLKENDPESRAQALTSCRRLLKSLADVLYPPKLTPVTGSDGKERILTDDMYISRLWQYVFEQTEHSTSGELLIAQVQYLGNRIDRLYDLTCKGVHGEINEFEVNQCVIQSYILIGDLLIISEKAVGSRNETQEL